MPEQTIKCPNCGAKIPLDEALKRTVKEELSGEYNQKWLEEKKKLEIETLRKAEETYNLQIRDMQNQLKEKEQKLKEHTEKELQLLKKQRELEEKEHSIKLELERKMFEERAKIKAETIEKIQEEHRLKDAEKDKTISDLVKQLDELKRKAEQGSQQAQGEVLEMEFEGQLRTLFPSDDIQPVPKGFKGADIIQIIKNSYGQTAGSIIWELKRTKAWGGDWISKLKDDQRAAKADLAAIVSSALPKDIVHIGNAEGVWVSDYSTASGLAMILRSSLLEISRVQSSLEGKSGKMEQLYAYLSGNEFRQYIQAIVEAFTGMQGDLNTEKRAMEKIWAKREKEIERVILNTTRLYGSLQSIIGGSLRPIEQLELPHAENQITE